MTGAARQLRLPGIGYYESRGLFSDHFLRDRLPTWREFAELDTSPLLAQLSELWGAERDALAKSNEAQTEERFIQPILAALGYEYTVHASLRAGSPGRHREPDYALFLSSADREAAGRLSGGVRYERAVAVAEAKRFDRPLDVRRAARDLSEDPVAQIVNYISMTRRRWGILTNGRIWRLYDAEGDLIEGASYQVDLVDLLERDDPNLFRYFAAFFSAAALLPDEQGSCFLARARDESDANAIEVGRALQRQVFSAVPLIASGLLGTGQRSPRALDDAFKHALVLLYRVLFCLHAEARELLPVKNPHYDPYSLRSEKRTLAHDIDTGRVFSERSDDIYNDLRALFRIVDQGDRSLDVTEYNGGLFAADAYPYFKNRSVPDKLLAPALDGLYRIDGKFIDYEDLSVRHLGTIYERLLEYRLEPGKNTTLELSPGGGRRESGSYFTPEHVVDCIVELTLEPLLNARSGEVRKAGLRGEDALEEFLGLSVLDPAMGSGHFLVAAAAYIAKYIATDPSYDGDLNHLEIQRLVTERCVYGVDVNPLAVELGKLSLWLTTVRRDEPLTFIHNLRAGNSLVGASVSDLLTRADTIFADRLSEQAKGMLRYETEIAALRSRHGEDVHEKERSARAVAALRKPLEEHANESIAPAFAEPPGRFFHWELEFPEVFLTADGEQRQDGGFDAVVGNPPYVRIQTLQRDVAEWCRRQYELAGGSFDVYIPFIERGLKLLAPHGRLGFIVPNKFLKLDYGRKMRQRLSDERLAEEIVDFGDSQVFEGATNYTCILILARDGASNVDYRRLKGDARAVRAALVDLDNAPAEHYAAKHLGGDPWTMATGEESRVLRAASKGCAQLKEVTDQIFQGLITSADAIYILEDRGLRGSSRLVYSRASEREIELEPELLHRLASGTDAERYAFKPLRNLLLFPYRDEDEAVRLMTADELSQLPLTNAYLRSHEKRLRGRERGKMDHENWWAYVYPKNLGAHAHPKLGVPRLCTNLRASADVPGSVYLDNVDVNGVLLRSDGISTWTCLVLLNSRLLDFVFRRFSVPFRGNFLSANKQFIAPLPIRLPSASQENALDALGERLHSTASQIGKERQGFLDWLGDTLQVRVSDLAGQTKIAEYDRRDVGDLLGVLRRNRDRLARDPDSRALRETIERERSASVDRLAELQRQLQVDESVADDLVYELYELPRALRELVDVEYS